jgi:asparagine synthase (glutamine-hydrolysing)
MRSSGHDPNFINYSLSLREARFKMLTPGKSTVEALRAEMGAAYDFEVRDPTLDKRLIEYCLGIPDKFYIADHDSYRLMIRHAMEGYLPDEVRFNKRRGMQSADIGYRLLADAQDLEKHFEALRHSTQAQTYLDIEKMHAVWLGLKHNIDSKISIDCVAILLRGLMEGIFLLKN